MPRTKKPDPDEKHIAQLRDMRWGSLTASAAKFGTLVSTAHKGGRIISLVDLGPAKSSLRVARIRVGPFDCSEVNAEARYWRSATVFTRTEPHGRSRRRFDLVALGIVDDDVFEDETEDRD